MKVKLLLLALAVLAGSSASAKGKYGEDSVECIKYLSYYQEYYKQKAYDDATPSWRNAYKHCPPSCSQNLLLNGQYLVRRLISKNSRNQEYKKALVDTLMKLHDLRVEYYPKYSVQALNSKGQDLFNYVKNDNQRLFDEYTKIIENNGIKTKPTLFIHRFNAAVNLYRDGKFKAENLISIYQESAATLDQYVSATESDAADVNSAKAELEARFVASRVADCETLVAFYEPKLAAAPGDYDLASTVVRVLSSAEGCTDNELFIKAVSGVYKERPSHTAAYYLFRLNAKKGNDADAVRFLEEAVAFEESDSVKDAEYLMELAQYSFSRGNKAKAYEAAHKASELDASKAGKAYYLIGNIWGSLSCGSGIEGAGKYWVAVDYMNKAKAADPSLAEEANICISKYSAGFPEVGEAFMYGIENGMTKLVSCGGLSASTVVRLRK